MRSDEVEAEARQPGDRARGSRRRRCTCGKSSAMRHEAAERRPGRRPRLEVARARRQARRERAARERQQQQEGQRHRTSLVCCPAGLCGTAHRRPPAITPRARASRGAFRRTRARSRTSCACLRPALAAAFGNTSTSQLACATSRCASVPSRNVPMLACPSFGTTTSSAPSSTWPAPCVGSTRKPPRDVPAVGTSVPR